MNTLKNLFFSLIILFSTCAGAAETLRPEKAFVPSVGAVDGDSIDLHIAIQPHYYLYLKRFSVTSEGKELPITAVELSAGMDKDDDFFGTQSVWYGGKNAANIRLHYDNPQQLTNSTLLLKYQGCHDGVLCYPPQKVRLPVTLPKTLPAAQPRRDASIELPRKNQQAHKTKPSWLKKKPTAPLLGKPSLAPLLPEDEAFAFDVVPLDATTVQVRFRIAAGYYLYRDKIVLHARAGRAVDDALLADTRFSEGGVHNDAFYGEQSIYRGEQGVINLYLQRPVADLQLDLSFQGCAEDRICYPVMQRRVDLPLPSRAGNVAIGKSSTALTTSVVTPSDSAATAEETLVDKMQRVLLDNLWAGMGVLFLAGLALAFTPCVLPMLPILLGIITNQRQVSKPRALWLSSAYALGVACMMAVLGLVVAKTGVNLAIVFQQPAWLIAFACLFIAMGLAMLGVFQVAVPAGVQMHVIRWQNRFQHSNAASLFIVGALSTLVVGPCVAPPLIAILAFISTTGDSLLGAVYLFALGMGMSLPLVVFASLITTVPKTGALSRLVTRLFALLMFGVGLWLLGRLWSGALSLALWGVWLLAIAGVLWLSGFVKPLARQFSKALAVACGVFGCVWLLGGVLGNSNPLKPFTPAVQVTFVNINNRAELQKALSQSDKPVILDLYADWCVSCQEVEHFTLSNPQVVEALSGYTRLKLDMSKTTDAHRALLKELDLIGPPVMLFFDRGKELKNRRYVGAISAETLLETLAGIQPKLAR